MDLMVKVAAGAITAAVLGVVLRKNTPELALLLALAAGLSEEDCGQVIRYGLRALSGEEIEE